MVQAVELSEKDRQILGFLADERDRKPPGYVEKPVLEARTNARYSEAYDWIWGLKFRHLVKLLSNPRSYKVLITEEGYRLVKPFQHKKQNKLFRALREFWAATLEGLPRGIIRKP
jgi:hypothetical protein